VDNGNKTDKTTIWGDLKYPKPHCADASSCQEAFLRRCDALGNLALCADPISGVLSAKRVKIAALMMAHTFKTWPEKRVAVMLPASASAAICTMALMIAGKTPVMLNWTLGRRNLEHAFSEAGARRVLSSSSFLSKLKNIELGKLSPAVINLESLKSKHWNFKAKVMAALKAKAPTSLLLKHLACSKLDGHEEALLLFTSGSEQNPKGVPLSHRNLLSNIRDALAAIPFDESDVMYGFLPPFHSFGFTVTTLFPLLTGTRIAFHPNPTEYRSLAQGCQRYGVTKLCGTPTFVGGVINGAKQGQLDSVKTFLVGAERMPENLVQRVEALGSGAEILEGYGITECAPVLTINRPGQKSGGVGQPLPSVQLKVVDLQNHQALPVGQRGLILARGPNIFSGYCGDAPDPFITIEGELWYNTGDLGFINDSGNLTLSGRLKRFVKVAGEMISLPAMESSLAEMGHDVEADGPAFVLHAQERDGQRPLITLFSVIDIDLPSVNHQLRKSGFSNICKVQQLEKVDSIPMLGTGKVNLGAIDKMAKQLGSH
jgi:long-chain-fatty-acid--[acyl-carrier-protein] ligase